MYTVYVMRDEVIDFARKHWMRVPDFKISPCHVYCIFKLIDCRYYMIYGLSCFQFGNARYIFVASYLASWVGLKIEFAKHEITMISLEQNQRFGKESSLFKVLRNFLSVYARRVSRKCQMRSTMWLGARFEVPIWFQQKSDPKFLNGRCFRSWGRWNCLGVNLGISPRWQWYVFMQFRA